MEMKFVKQIKDNNDIHCTKRIQNLAIQQSCTTGGRVSHITVQQLQQACSFEGTFCGADAIG